MAATRAHHASMRTTYYYLLLSESIVDLPQRSIAENSAFGEITSSPSTPALRRSFRSPTSFNGTLPLPIGVEGFSSSCTDPFTGDLRGLVGFAGSMAESSLLAASSPASEPSSMPQPTRWSVRCPEEVRITSLLLERSGEKGISARGLELHITHALSCVASRSFLQPSQRMCARLRPEAELQTATTRAQRCSLFDLLPIGHRNENSITQICRPPPLACTACTYCTVAHTSAASTSLNILRHGLRLLVNNRRQWSVNMRHKRSKSL